MLEAGAGLVFEGEDNGEWVLDLGDIVVHVYNPPYVRTTTRKSCGRHADGTRKAADEDSGAAA